MAVNHSTRLKYRTKPGNSTRPSMTHLSLSYLPVNCPPRWPVQRVATHPPAGIHFGTCHYRCLAKAVTVILSDVSKSSRHSKSWTSTRSVSVRSASDQFDLPNDWASSGHHLFWYFTWKGSRTMGTNCHSHGCRLTSDYSLSQRAIHCMHAFATTARVLGQVTIRPTVSTKADGFILTMKRLPRRAALVQPLILPTVIFCFMLKVTTRRVFKNTLLCFFVLIS